MADCDIRRCRTLNDTGLFCNDADTGVYCGLYFHTCSDNRSFCSKKRHRLTLHVRSHQRTVGIVIFQERNQCCRYGEHHLRRNVHEIKLASLVFLCLLAVTSGYISVDEVSFLVQRFIRLCNVVVVFLICRHVDYFFCDDRILRIFFIYLTVWSLDKSILIDPCIGCKGVD